MPTRARSAPHDLTGLPGADRVLSGLQEFDRSELTENGLLLLVASPRLRRLGFEIPERPDIARPYEHQLYALLERTHGEGAYSRYNSLLRRIVSFCRALEHRNAR